MLWRDDNFLNILLQQIGEVGIFGCTDRLTCVVHRTGHVEGLLDDERMVIAIRIGCIVCSVLMRIADGELSIVFAVVGQILEFDIVQHIVCADGMCIALAVDILKFAAMVGSSVVKRCRT